MKKTKIAVGVIVALGVVWTAGAWFTGKQLEKKMDQMVQQANEQIQEVAPESRLKVSYQDYQRGVFSSSARFILQSSSQTEDNSVLKPGQTVEFKEVIDHGPLPLAQLKKVNLIPSMASVHTELLNTDAVKKLFEVTKGKSIVQGETRIGYGGSTHSDIHLLPTDYSNAQSGERFAFDGGTLKIDVDDKGDKITFNADVGNVQLTGKNQLDAVVTFDLSGLRLDANTHLSPEGMRIGDQTVALQKLIASVNGKEALTAEGLNGKSTFDSKENRVSGQIDYTLNGLKIDGQNFGKGKLSMKLADFDGKAMKAFSENYNRQLQTLSADTALQANPELYQQRASEILTANLPLLLKGDPSITIAPFSWTNDKGESTFTLSAQFKDPANAAATAQSPSQQLDSVLKSLDTKLAISMDMATDTMTHVALAEGYSREDAARLADQQVKGLAAMGQMFKVTTQQDNNIVTSLQYAAGQVTMNGEKMPLEQFLTRYMMGDAIPAMPQ
ncbi:YdgA family protein [Erwinia amylovora]|uniref:YdgA family protein n=1 Tax=Erwinia amylovora TaxID=552 RepID=UPI0002CA3667|nr:YdgA family protein [Erwinia amylovora]QPG16027.1 YdgA family protein [Erwinia amylovora]CCO78586.1 Protein ydgA precursor [Erwinia amylovora Ea356]